MHKHYIVGTAGHIDHGKTTLAKSLTGKDTDRLKEEKERNISIELGFAPFALPNGDQVSLIDVPGHEKFIRHMVAGVGGIDLVLFVIAADEGVMPQTREHMQIIELLGIEHGIIVLTKKDMVDNEFLELVEEEVKNFIDGTTLKNAPIISVSSISGDGIETLKQQIANELTKISERSTSGYFYMPIDRVFTLKGIGTVITGTIYSGKVNLGQELEIMPKKLPARVRSLQVHSESVDTAYAGQRVAINVAGIDINELERGDSITYPNQWEPSNRVDVELTIVKDIDFSIKQDSEIKFHIGTTEAVGQLILYDRKEINAGEKVYCQIKLNKEIIASRKERFIIRRPSPSLTIGGGIIIEPNAKKHKYNKETVEKLREKIEGTASDLIYNLLNNDKQPIITLTELSSLLKLPENELENNINELIEEDRLLVFTDLNIFSYGSKERFITIEKDVIDYLTNYHEKFPLRLGQTKAEFVKNFFPNVKSRSFDQILKYWEDKGIIKIKEEYISLFSFTPALPKNLEQKAKELEKYLIEQKFTPDTWDELTERIGVKGNDKVELFNLLLNQKTILKLTDKMVIHRKAFDELRLIITEFLEKEGKITLQQAKEILEVSRKYLVPLMELLDSEKVTVLRQGDNYRELRKKNL